MSGTKRTKAMVAQHMPERFTQAFATRLDSICEIRVKQAEGGERVLPGQALIAPGDRHLQVRRQGADHHAGVKDGPPVSRHSLSGNVLFGMPKGAIKLGAADVVLPLDDLHEAVMGQRNPKLKKASSA